MRKSIQDTHFPAEIRTENREKCLTKAPTTDNLRNVNINVTEMRWWGQQQQV
jgi:hypothetical protein